MPLPLIVGTAVASGGRWLAQRGLTTLGEKAIAWGTKQGITQGVKTGITTTTKEIAEETAKKGFFGKVKSFLIPETKLGKAAAVGITGYSLFGGSDAEASQGQQDDNKMSYWKTALAVAGVGGLGNSIMGGSFLKGALTAGTATLGAVWIFNDLNSNPSVIKGLAKKVLPPETYQSIFGASNNLKELANPNAQDTQDIKDNATQQKEQEKAEQKAEQKRGEELNQRALDDLQKENAKLKEQNATLEQQKWDLTNSNDHIKMAMAVCGDKNLTDEQKIKALESVVTQMNETEKTEFFTQLEKGYQQALDNAVATDAVKGMGQDEREIEQSYKDAEKAKQEVSDRANLMNDIMGNFGNITKEAQNQIQKVEEQTNETLKSANPQDNTTFQSLNEQAAQGATIDNANMSLGQNVVVNKPSDNDTSQENSQKIRTNR